MVNAVGIKMNRETWDLDWPDPQELTTLRDGLISDHVLISKLRAYLENHETQFKRTHGLQIRGAIDITFVDGKMTLSCFEETDFATLRRVLEVLDGFQSWSAKSLETPPQDEPLGSCSLDLV